MPVSAGPSEAERQVNDLRKFTAPLVTCGAGSECHVATSCWGINAST